MDKVKLFRLYFRGREDTFAEQTSSGYIRVVRLISDTDILSHLTGSKSYGIYTIIPPDKTYFLMLDIDNKDLIYVERLNKACIKAGIKQEQLLPEDTGGRGHHIWVFFEKALEAQTARKLGQIIIALAEIDIEVEIFPKQDKVEKNGFGSLVKLPFGVHKVTGKRSMFLNNNLEPVSSWSMACKVSRRYPNPK
jgi:hypothetical protein